MKSKKENYIIITPEFLKDYTIKWIPVEVLAWTFEDFPELIIYDRYGFNIAHRNSGLVLSTCKTLGEAKSKIHSAQNKLEEYKKTYWEKISLETDFRNNILKRQGE